MSEESVYSSAATKPDVRARSSAAMAGLALFMLLAGASHVFAQERAQLTSPTPGSTLISSSVTFRWTTTTPTVVWLDVGTSFGGHQIFSQNEGTNTEAVVEGLPLVGSVYVRLWSYIGTAWQFADYGYIVINSGIANAQLTTPPPSSSLTASTVTFRWTGGTLAAGIVVAVNV